MKITKDLLRAMRRDAKTGRILQLSPEEGVLFLDERKELRRIIKDNAETIGLSVAEEAALALGEDE